MKNLNKKRKNYLVDSSENFSSPEKDKYQLIENSNAMEEEHN